MGWTKEQLIQEAFNELALGDVFNVGADERETALRRLDTMMATWNSVGIRLGYALPSSPDGSDIDADSGLPDSAYETVYSNLAVRLAAGYGKTVSADTRVAATRGYSALLADAVRPTSQPLPGGLPRGAGNKPWRGGYPAPFFPDPADTLDAGDDGPLIV